MKILITNDDGVSSPILPHLIRWAKTLGEVTAVAPKYEQSAKSQAINIRDAVEVKQISIAPDIVVYAMDSTPADCVRFGVLGLGEKYDLVISGVNRGYNVGHDIAYSGTVGAIFEASRLGINGLAISTHPDNLIDCKEHFDTIYDFIVNNRLYEYNNLYNVNIPSVKSPKGICITRQGGMYFSDAFESRGKDMFIQVGAPVLYGTKQTHIDIEAIEEGFISISPLTADKTALAAFEQLKGLNKI